jgi:hypothetical protein
MQATTVDQTRLKTGATVRVTVDKYTVRKYNLPSRTWQGEIKDTEPWKQEHASRGLTKSYLVGTLKALKLDAAPVLEECAYCLNCSIHLETDLSRTFGYCLGCAVPFGIPNWANFTEDVLDELRQSLAEQFRRHEFWVQLEVSDVEIIEDAPEQAPAIVDWDVRFIIDNGNIVVTTADIERFRTVVRSVPGYRWDARYNVWRFNASPATAIALKEAFDGYRRRGTKEFITLVNKAEGQKKAQSIKVRTDLPPIPGVKGNGGYLHQRACVFFCYKVLTGEDWLDERTNGDD